MDEYIDELRGALCTARDQIEQMKGMFNDEDGSIARALEDIEAALTREQPKPIGTDSSGHQ